MLRRSANNGTSQLRLYACLAVLQLAIVAFAVTPANMRPDCDSEQTST